MEKPIIEVRNLGKCYRLGQIGITSLREQLELTWHNLVHRQKRVFGDFWALREVDFSVQRGEVLGVIGRNGAGKSTLLKILSRITPPTTGQVTLRGRVSSLLEVGTGFHEELTGRENIYLNGTILGMKKREIDAKFDEIVAFAGVEEFVDTPVKRYSSGMTVRLGFAVAAHLEPDILIVDEVLAVGDAEFQKKCIGKMKDVAGHGRTVLFVSHNMAIVAELCPKVLCLKAGTISGMGDGPTVVSQYLKYSVPQFEDGNGEFIQQNQESSPEIRVSSLRITSADGPEHEISFRSPPQFHLRIENKQRARQLTACVTLRDEQLRKIFQTENRQDIPPGQCELQVTMPPEVLLPGRYIVETALHIPNIALFDHVPEAGFFEVSALGSPFAIYGNTETGPIYVKCHWQKQEATVAR